MTFEDLIDYYYSSLILVSNTTGNSIKELDNMNYINYLRLEKATFEFLKQKYGVDNKNNNNFNNDVIEIDGENFW